MARQSVFEMPFEKVYQCLVQKAERKGRTQAEVDQVIKWLKNPHTDSAEYKMWGNGVALPCVFFVLAGIAYYAG